MIFPNISSALLISPPSGAPASHMSDFGYCPVIRGRSVPLPFLPLLVFPLCRERFFLLLSLHVFYSSNYEFTHLFSSAGSNLFMNSFLNIQFSALYSTFPCILACCLHSPVADITKNFNHNYFKI